MKRRPVRREYVVCLDNAGYRASLQLRRLYRLIPDPAAQKRGLLRVVDESGEEYLFPRKLFAVIELPRPALRRFALTT